MLPYILFKKYIHIIIIGNGQSREPALCQLYRHTFVPYIQAADEISEEPDGAKRELDFGVDERRSEVSLMKSLGSSRGSQGARSAAWTDTKSTSVSTNTLSTLLCGSKNIRLKISVTFFRSASPHARHAEHVSAVPAAKYPLTAHIYFSNFRSLRSRSTLRPRY